MLPSSREAHQGYREKVQKRFHGEEDAWAKSQEKNKHSLNSQIGGGEGGHPTTSKQEKQLSRGMAA